EIRKHLLEDAVVFFDPDNGLEVGAETMEQKGRECYLRDSDLQGVAGRWGSNSIFVAISFPNNNRQLANAWINAKAADLRDIFAFPKVLVMRYGNPNIVF